MRKYVIWVNRKFATQKNLIGTTDTTIKVTFWNREVSI